MPQPSHNRLFQQKTLQNALNSFQFPDDLEARHQKLLPWIKTLDSGTLDEVKETSLHGDFLKDVFQSVLGYRSVIAGEGQRWELHAEQTISDGGGSADGALGFFTATESKKGAVKLQGRVVAPIELKGAKNDLDRVASGRHESAVDQGWRYANYTADCRWVLVSNYREVRLYQTSKTPAYYEEFRLKDLQDLDRFKAFYFILCRENFLPPVDDPKGRSATDKLLIASDKAEVDITKSLYEEYKQVRLNLARQFRTTGPTDLPDRDITLIEKAQKTLDRVLFIAFCEDKDLLPRETLRQAHDHTDPYNPRSIWDNYKAVFRAVDEGNEALSIPGYNGGLFKHDPILDEQLTVSDLLCTQLNKLTRYDFDSEVSVNILGHIFEQSVTDLEELRALSAGEEYDQKKGKRKTQGVYYTPAFITQYIVGIALGGYLERKEKALWHEMGIDQIRANAVRQRRKAEIQFWERYRDEVLVKTRVIDPACGSGAFLIAAFDFLNQEYERVNEQLAALQLADDSGQFVGQRSLFDLTQTILNQNLYGVDLSPESVEITKLSLWLKTAERGKQLTYLDDNIKVGNSIIADPTVAPRAFDWQTEFADVFADGGFDVVIGNPPYVRQELLSPFKPYLEEHYASYDGVADLYVYFYEKGLNILRPNGILSYIVTNKWLRAGYGEPLRKFFAENSVFEQIIDFGHAPIFEDADVFPCIVAVRKPVTGEEEAFTEVMPVHVCPIPREKLEDINLSQYSGFHSNEVHL
jgi:type I restriction-modification system DNA methylase subunit